MNLDIALAFVGFRYLRVFADTQSLPEKWKRQFDFGFYISLGFLVGSVFFNRAHFIGWIGWLTLFYIAYTVWREEVFKPMRWLLLACAPYLLASFVNNIVETALPGLYKKWEDYIDTAVLCTLAWMLGVYLMTRNQRKALETQRQRLKEKEEQILVTEAMKNQLELEVAERTRDINRQKEALQEALHELKATQAQLIQSEKMASLGELTAGIAHEIQNPLNFVTNFSDVSKELVDELLTELKNNNPSEAAIVARDLQANLDKIMHHGRRADSIVKGMLQHSRTSTGQKESTDINLLADEYLRLAYHGLRAKDKSFNATLHTEFDPAIGNMNLAAQEIGRVLLNLINNAFYAVQDKKAEVAEQPAAGKPYEPTVTVRTKRLGNSVEVTVMDNGKGIPEEIRNKIFQPFFTTKPTGQGTGLGLSLSYDIVKAHGGTLQVVSPVPEYQAGAAFVLRLPLNARNG